jgi:mRNA interferase MazF
VKRGEIWWAEPDSPGERRPVLLLSRDDAYSVRSLVIIAPVTTHMRHIASEVPLGADDGLPQDCAVTLDTITTIPRDCLKSRLTALSIKKLKEIDGALRFVLGIE